MTKTITIALRAAFVFAIGVGIIVPFSPIPASATDFSIVDPDKPVADHTQRFWSQAWWQWLLSSGAVTNPNLDTTGNNAYTNNFGNIFFLAGTFGGGAVTRTIYVPHGKPVFFPVVNEFYNAINATGQFDPSPCKTLSLSCALNLLSPFITGATGLSVTIDGTTLNGVKIKSFRQTSASFFTVSLPTDNVINAVAGTQIPEATYFPPSPIGHGPVWASDGYWIMLDNLSSGVHKLHFKGIIGGVSIDVTDTLHVQE